MKKLIFYITVIFFSVSLYTSCTVDEGDNPDRLTARGMTMTDEWSRATQHILHCYADIAFQLHDYIENGSHYKGVNGLSIQNTGDDEWDVFVNGELAYTINTSGQPLDSVGAVWELVSFAGFGDLGLRQDDYTVNFTITCIDTNNWNFYSINSDLPEYFFDVNISCKTTPSTLVTYPFAFEGKGNLYLDGYYYEYGALYYFNSKMPAPEYVHYSSVGPVNLSFETESGLQITPDYWSKGIVNITVMNMEDEVSSTRAEFYRKNTEYVAKITYGGVTEEWYPFYYYYEAI